MSEQEPQHADGEAGAVPASAASAASRPLHAPPPPIAHDRPEALVGAAFGGGLVAAVVLRGLARRRRR